MIDDGKDEEEDEADAKAPADQLFFDRQQRLGLRLAKFLADIDLRHGVLLPQLAKGGFTPLKNSQEINKPTQMTKPNRLTR